MKKEIIRRYGRFHEISTYKYFGFKNEKITTHDSNTKAQTMHNVNTSMEDNFNLWEKYLHHIPNLRYNKNLFRTRSFEFFRIKLF